MAGPARTFAFGMGLAFAALAAYEVYLGITSDELRASGTVWLDYAGLHNAIHWLVALVLLSSLYFGRYPAKMTAWTLGSVFAVFALLSLFARGWLGDALGHGGPVPWGLVVVNFATATLGLFVGYGSNAKPGMTRKHLRKARGA